MNWIADTLARMRNAILLKRENVLVRGTKIVNCMLDVMQKEGFVNGFEVKESKMRQSVLVSLKYCDNEPVIRSIVVKSKPSLRKYESVNELKKYGKKQFACAIVSTSLGVLSSNEAIRKNVGGEVLCEVY